MSEMAGQFTGFGKLARRTFIGSVLGSFLTPKSWADTPRKARIFVNQSGYGRSWPKRATVIGELASQQFEVLEPNTAKVSYRGTIVDGVADFSDHAIRGAGQYVLRVLGSDGKAIDSDRFWIDENLPLDVALEQALRFMVDVRSLTGTHPSAYGGRAFRDQTYYTYELPSLVMLWLSHPDYFETRAIEMDYAADRQKILDRDFDWVRDTGDSGALEAARRYYTELDGPSGDHVPDIIQLIHWVVGFQLVAPESEDPSGDPAGRRVHAQTVEEFAFFLYALPTLEKWFTGAFIDRVRAFTLNAWKRAGLFDVITEVGGYKGRHAPGHSVLPNLMMHEFAKRNGELGGKGFLKAAVAQAEWIVRNVDLANPMSTKGQRMSEHKLAVGLTILQLHYPEHAPRGLAAFLERYAELIVQRSRNQWDFRRFDEMHWTIPRHSADNPAPADETGGSAHGWNEVGNVAGLPAIGTSLARVSPARNRGRLFEISVAHLDALFGRNPLGAHSANRGAIDYPGVERGWPVAYGNDICARLERVRGSISSSASDEQYQLGPLGTFRHPEGWTAFNAAFNVSLASMMASCRVLTVLDENKRGPADRIEANRVFYLSVNTPRGFGRQALHQIKLQLEGATRSIAIAEWSDELSAFISAPMQFNDLMPDDSSAVLVSYGSGYWKNSIRIDRKGSISAPVLSGDGKQV